MYNRVRVGSRIFVMFLLVIVLFLGGLIWFDILGLMDVQSFFKPVYRLFGIGTATKVENLDSVSVLESERQKKQWEALEIRADELDMREKAIVEQENELNQFRDALAEKEKAQTEREKSFNDRLEMYENRNANLREQADILKGMPLAKAVERLERMDQQDIIDIFRITNEEAAAAGEFSLVPTWLGEMKPETAAEIQRKMLKKPQS